MQEPCWLPFGGRASLSEARPRSWFTPCMLISPVECFCRYNWRYNSTVLITTLANTDLVADSLSATKLKNNQSYQWYRNLIFTPLVVYFRSKGSLWGSLSPKKDTLMTYRTYLIRKTPTSSYLFRIKIPIDLRDFFGGRTQFKVSLGTGIKSQSLVISSTVYTEVQSIFQSVRMGLEEL